MKRWIKVLCIVLGLLAALLAGLYWWQRENVKAVKDAVSYTSEELEEKMTENQQVIRDAVDAAPEIVVREVTEEERQALRDGTITQEELVERLLDTGEQTKPTVNVTAPLPAEGNDQKPAEQPSESKVGTPTGTESPTKTETAPAEGQKPVESVYQKELSAIIAKVYVLREEYTLTLDNMYNAAKTEYINMPAEKRTKTNLAKMASRYLDKATSLEKECDQKMDAIVSSMEKLIKENKGDMSLVDTMVYTYANEKSLKKAWYMSKLEEKGLV